MCVCNTSFSVTVQITEILLLNAVIAMYFSLSGSLMF